MNERAMLMLTHAGWEKTRVIKKVSARVILKKGGTETETETKILADGVLRDRETFYSVQSEGL